MAARAQTMAARPSPRPTRGKTAPASPAPRQRARATRADGWTPDRRRTFLEALSEGHTVEAACGVVGLSVASAYALRQRRGGEAFAVGWRSACLIARDRLSDELYSRALQGVTESVTRADGETVTRHRYDNRLAMAMLTRLDKLAEHPRPDHLTPQDTTDPFVRARAVAADFTHFLALVEAGCGARDVAEFVELSESRRNPQLPQLNDTQIPPSQWLENEELDEDLAEDFDDEEGGIGDEEDALVTVAAPVFLRPVVAPLRPEPEQDPLAPWHACDAIDAPGPVWFNVMACEWRTTLPPPPDFDLQQRGDHRDRGYWRPLDRHERAMLDTVDLREAIARLITLREAD